MSNPIPLPPIDPRSYIRTFVPVIIGAILGWAITTYTVVAEAIAWLDSVLAGVAPGTSTRALLDALAIAAVTAAYYWIARRLGRRFPKLEAWLLGSSATPVYGLAAAEIVDAQVYLTDTEEA